jgi:hypothetical protein
MIDEVSIVWGGGLGKLLRLMRESAEGEKVSILWG